MRIGIVTGEYPPLQGGVGAYSQIMAQTLISQGHNVFVFSNRLACEGGSQITLTNALRRWRLSSLWTIKRWAKANRIDVVNLQYQTAAFGMSPWIHFMPDVVRGIPFVTTFHDLLFPYLFPKAGRVRTWIVKRLASASTGTIVTNHEDMEQLKHLPNATLIPIGSNILASPPSSFNRATQRQQAGAAEDDFLIAYFGFVNRSKGLETLLTALAILIHDGQPTKLVMIGGRTGSSDPSNVEYIKEIDNLIAHLNLQTHIHWTGYVNDTDVAAYLEASDAVALPFRDGASYRRGSLMAAIQHHRPIITTRPKVAVPTFQHNENMLLFPADDAPALADAIQSLRQNPATCAQLSRGAQSLSHYFDWKIIAQEYVTFFEHLLGERA